MARGPRGNRSNPQFDAETRHAPRWSPGKPFHLPDRHFLKIWKQNYLSIVFTTWPPFPQIQCANDSLHILGLSKTFIPWNWKQVFEILTMFFQYHATPCSTHWSPHQTGLDLACYIQLRNEYHHRGGDKRTPGKPGHSSA